LHSKIWVAYKKTRGQSVGQLVGWVKVS